jgi:predicted O-linked N-acetylglucosamine transferase (SPINDLY family)
MDYRLSDARLDPPGFESHYTERTIYLPDAFWCYDPLTDRPAVNPLPAIERGFVTFGCLNNPFKLSDRTFGLWARVMARLPEARLMLLAPRGTHRQRLTARLEAHGIAAARISFSAVVPRADYLKLYHQIDIGLDTLPYNGHTTSLDSFWMGVPVLTRMGNTCVGRGGVSQLYQLNLMELACETDEAFVEKAVELATDSGRVSQLRKELRRRLADSPLMDGPRFARNMERIFRDVNG